MIGRIRAPYLLNGVSQESNQSSGMFPMIDELSAKDVFEELKAEGMSCKELLRELESLREVITIYLFIFY